MHKIERQKKGESMYIGVSPPINHKKWQACIQRENLGVFLTEEEAGIARNKRAQELNDQGAFYKIESYRGPTNYQIETYI